MSNAKHIFHVGLWTAISRVLGFGRDMIFASVLGAGRLSDIFWAAFKLPNMFRDLLGEGALSAVFVPMFAEHKHKKRAGPLFASNVFSWLMAVLLGLTIIAEIIMPLIMWVSTPGFAADPTKFQMTIFLSRLMFGYVVLVCGTAFLSAILNAFSEFSLAAMMSSLLNVFMIFGLLAARYFGGGVRTLYILAGVVMLSGFVQMWILWARIRRRNFGLRLIRPRWTRGIRDMMRRMGTTIIGSGFYQVNILVGMLVASFQAGAISWLYYSDRMVQMPYAIIGLAAGTVLLTSLSDALKKNDMASVHAQQNTALRQSLMLTLPAVAGLIALAGPINAVLFEHGAWTHATTIAVAAAIMIQALCIPAMTTSQIYSKTLYAAQDVKTPVRTSVISLIVSSVIYVVLVWFVGYLAVPIGTVVGGYVKNILLLRVLRRRGLFVAARRTVRAVIAFGTLSVIMGVALYIALRAGLITGALSLVIAIAIGCMFYLPLAYIANKKIR